MSKGVQFSTEDFIKLAAELKTDGELRKTVHRDPLAYLESVGVEVEERFKAVVKQQLELVSAGKPAANLGPPPAGSFVFTTNAWGLVLVIDEAGMQWLKDASAEAIGEAIGAALSELAASSTDPIIGAVAMIAAFWCTTQAVWILAEYGMMAAMDEAQHKGIYLTWTWVGLALTCYVPFPTPIT